MKILVACEFSGTVRDAFARQGHTAYSCDLLPSETPGNHFQCDTMEVLDYGWDIIIMHPPCTAICLSGNRTYGKGKAKHQERLKALDWTSNLWNRAKDNAPQVMLENPANVLGAHIGKRTQEVQPWQFGHPRQKETWLWLHNLPPLKPTGNVHDEMMKLPKSEREEIFYASPGPLRGQFRSRTFQGIADAMATQWSDL